MSERNSHTCGLAPVRTFGRSEQESALSSHSRVSKKTKFLQIHTFYERYLSEFYQQNPWLGDAGFDEQISTLLRDGFGISHMFAAWMHRLGWDSHLVIANCVLAQAQWASEHGVTVNNTQQLKTEIVRKQVELLNPDVLYLSDPITFDSKFVRSLSRRPSLVVGWRAACIPEGTDWSSFDVILSHLAVCRQRALELGAKAAEHFHPGFVESLYEAVKNEPKRYDVVFTGQWTGEHTIRNRFLREIAKAASNPDNRFSVGFFIHSGSLSLPEDVGELSCGARWGLDMYRVLRSGRIVINGEIDLAQGEAGNMRLFETTGVGSFLLTQYQTSIGQYFAPGREVETFKDEKELIEKIRYYLAHPMERETIAKRGQERCLRDYTMETRSKEFDRIIRKHWYLKTSEQSKNERPKPSITKSNSSLRNGGVQKEMSLDDLVKMYPRVSFGKCVQILGVKNTQIGEGSCIGDDTWLNVVHRDQMIRIRIGKKVAIGRRCTISAGGYVEIADYCLLAPNVCVSEADHIFEDTTKPTLVQGVTSGSLIMEENCRCGINVVINGSITIGRGSVVGANSIVLNDVPPFSVVVGNPARIVKMYNPGPKRWERIRCPDDINRIHELRDIVGIPSREQYKKILEKDSKCNAVSYLAAGNGISI